MSQHIKDIAKIGDQVFVVGELKTSTWKNNTTNEIWTREIRILKEKPDKESELPMDLSKIGTPVLETELESRKRKILSGEKTKHAERLKSGYYGGESDDNGMTTGDDLYGAQW